MNSLFGVFGGKTKFFASIMAVVASLEGTGVVPVGTGEAAAQVVTALATLGVLWGIADKLDRLVK